MVTVESVTARLKKKKKKKKNFKKFFKIRGAGLQKGEETQV